MNINSGGVESMWGGTLGSQSTMDISPAGFIGNGVRPNIHSTGYSSIPPPIPNRSLQNGSTYTSLNYPMNSRLMNYSSYGMGSYPYNSYGGYPRRMYGGYGMGTPGFGAYQEDYDASMMQAIDESCQTLFGPFDSLVQSISSIAMVLDSTYQAMQYSFRTILSSADSLSKLKNIIIQLASSFSLFKFLKAIYYKILRLLGLINANSVRDKEWTELFNKAITGNPGELPNQTQSSPWLALGFFGLMMGGPYLMFKLFYQNLRNRQQTNALIVGPDCIDAVAMYDFDAANAQELSIKQGERLKISKSRHNQNWALATNGRATGFVPFNRLSISSPARQKVVRNYAVPEKQAPLNKNLSLSSEIKPIIITDTTSSDSKLPS